MAYAIGVLHILSWTLPRSSRMFYPQCAVCSLHAKIDEMTRIPQVISIDQLDMTPIDESASCIQNPSCIEVARHIDGARDIDGARRVESTRCVEGARDIDAARCVDRPLRFLLILSAPPLLVVISNLRKFRMIIKSIVKNDGLIYV